VTRDGIDRHLSNEAHDNLLEKQGKTAAFPSPWGFDTSDPMFRAIDPRQSGCEVAVMLEEVEMPPREFLEVMSPARGSALGTRIQRSAVGTDLQVELGWRMVGIETLAHNFPGRRKAEAQGKDFFSLHGSPPEGGLPKLIEVGQFHIKRRRTTNYLLIRKEMQMNDPRRRPDISRFLVHLTRNTRGVEAEDNLINILKTKMIEARNHHCLFSPKINKMTITPKLKNTFKTVCFTETPLDQIDKLAAEDFPRKIRLQSYGLVFWRDNMIKSGVNPAIYLNDDGTTLRDYLLSEFDRQFKGVNALRRLKEKEEYYQEIVHYYSLVNIIREKHDFSWEREWRHSGSFKFNYSDVVAIVAKDPEHFLKRCESEFSPQKAKYIRRLPIISASWTYEDVVEEMAIKIWEANV
jgi:hypothetical protein